MSPSPQPFGLPPRLAARAHAAGVDPAAVVLTATGLLVRRYTGSPVVTLRHGDDPVTLDLTADAPIRELCRSLRPAPPELLAQCADHVRRAYERLREGGAAIFELGDPMGGAEAWVRIRFTLDERKLRELSPNAEGS